MGRHNWEATMTEYFKCLESGQFGPVTHHPWVPGEWQRVTGRLVACRHGFHVVDRAQVFRWGSDELWQVEVDPRYKTLERDDKTVVRQMRITKQITGWNARNLRLFAADCAERALPVFEEMDPNDDRPRETIAAVRAYARGEIDVATLYAACVKASDAGYAYNAGCGLPSWPARDAAWAASGAAGWAGTSDTADSWEAARCAAKNAAQALPGDAEVDWQINRLWSTYLTPGGNDD